MCSCEDRELLAEQHTPESLWAGQGKKSRNPTEWVLLRNVSLRVYKCVSKEPSPGWLGLREKCVCVCVVRLPEHARLHSCPGFNVNVKSCAGRAGETHLLKAFHTISPGKDNLATVVCRSVVGSGRDIFLRSFGSRGGKHINSAHWPSCSEVKNKLIFYQKACLDLLDRSTMGQEEHE